MKTLLSFPLCALKNNKARRRASHLGTWEAEIGRIQAQGQPRQIVPETPHLQNNHSKMDWRCGSRGRVPALQVLGSNSSPTETQEGQTAHHTDWLQEPV
jgi:hypothetical protein